MNTYNYMSIYTLIQVSGIEINFVPFERTDIIQTGNFSFCYNRCSTLSNDSLKSIDWFRIQLLLEENTCKHPI